MKFTLGWLADHLETEAGLDEIVAALTDIGLEVDGVDDPATKLGAFRICRVIEAMPHPNADRLRLCRVETRPDGPGGRVEEVQVVCGAPNARTGLVGVFAAPGTYVPGTDLLLKPGEIRGVASNGMLCSERELMVSEDHDGIIDLPADAPLGARYIDYAGLADPVIDIAVTPNRPDALGVRGVARDLAARGLGRLKPETAKPVAGRFPSPIAVRLGADVVARSETAEAACPIFVGRLIRGVRNGPSPDWLQKRLRAVGLRPINALVDVTNYLSFDRARPLHVFDADKLDGPVAVRFATDGERLVGLDDKEHVFEAGMTLVCDRDGARVVGIGGVMGGRETGCDVATTNVFVEAAYFDPTRTASTGRALKINSDARYRFERGVDPLSAEPGIERATQMILELCGGEPAEIVVAGAPPREGRNAPSRVIRFDFGHVARLVGLDVPKTEQTRILKALGFSVGRGGATVEVTTPSWRPDIGGAPDLVEEIARIASLSKLPAQPLPRPEPGVARPVLTPMQTRLALARRALAARGLAECVTYSFIEPAQAERFGGGDAARRLENPIAADKSDLRPSLLPGLLAAAARNQARGVGDVALFELGPEFIGGAPGDQREVATLLRVGASAARHWAEPRRPVDFFDAKADAEALMALLGAPIERLMLDRETSPWLHPGRSARLKLGPKVVLAEIGELHPRILAAFDLRGPAVATTLMLEAIPFPKATAKTRPPLVLHDLQPVSRDFAFVVDAGAEAAAVLRAARSADKALVVDAQLFDVFAGAKAEAGLGAGKKSIAISVTMQPTERTLTDKDIETASDKIVAAVSKAVGATLRA